HCRLSGLQPIHWSMRIAVDPRTEAAHASFRIRTARRSGGPMSDRRPSGFIHSPGEARSGDELMTDDPTQPPELEAEDILVLDDPYFTSENVALVTGGASGIGRATALALAHNGLTVVATDIDEDGLDRTVENHTELDLDGAIHTVAGDLTDDDDIETVV